MRQMTLNNIASACNGNLVIPDGIWTDAEKEAAGVVLDSRLVEKDYVFIATPGERVDGHSFIESVFEKGAMAVICERKPEKPRGPYILVENSFTALTQVATYYRQCLMGHIKVVGVTGSVGKTSTKEFIATVLSEKYNVLKTQGNFNNDIGVPLTLLRIRDEHEIAVVEMGINHFGEMSGLTKVARPDVAVITNIGVCHLENLIDRDGVLRAKTEIFEGLNKEGQVFINGDDDKLISIDSVNGKKPVTFGMSGSCDYTAVNVENLGLKGSSCTIKGEDVSFDAKVPLPGQHMVLNALCASAIGRYFDMDGEAIASGIGKCKGVGGRSNIIQLNDYTVIDDCYNANPTSVKAAIDLLGTAIGRKVAILGDMFELGNEEKDLHRQVGIYAKDHGVDVLVCIGNLSANTYEGAEGIERYHYNTVAEFIATLDDNEASPLISGDSILVKASHSMAFEGIVEKLQKMGQV